jgi:carbon-monoxide dehydrogenase medium subunit
LTESERSRAAEHATESLDETMMMDDLQASAEYRANLVRTYTERALERATDRLEGEHHA